MEAIVDSHAPTQVSVVAASNRITGPIKYNSHKYFTIELLGFDGCYNLPSHYLLTDFYVGFGSQIEDYSTESVPISSSSRGGGSFSISSHSIQGSSNDFTGYSSYSNSSSGVNSSSVNSTSRNGMSGVGMSGVGMSGVGMSGVGSHMPGMGNPHFNNQLSDDKSWVQRAKEVVNVSCIIHTLCWC